MCQNLPAFQAALTTSLRVRACEAPPTTSYRRAQRVAVGVDSYERLRRRAEIFGTSPSRLGSVILDEYLAHSEQFYLGARRAQKVVMTAGEGRGIDAVIFDMDGVLCDSELASRDCAVAALVQLYGERMDGVKPEEFGAFTGMGEGKFLGGVAGLYGIGDDEFDEAKAKEKFFELYLYGGYMRAVQAYPGVKSLVKRLREAGLKVGVASAADAIKVKANLEAIGLDEKGLFDFVTSSDDIVNKKPAPDVFLACAKGLDVDPTRCSVVEDAVAGVQAAKAAGMRCVAVATSMDDGSLAEAGADLVRGEPALISLEDLFGEPLVSSGTAAAESSSSE